MRAVRSSESDMETRAGGRAAEEGADDSFISGFEATQAPASCRKSKPLGCHTVDRVSVTAKPECDDSSRRRRFDVDLAQSRPRATGCRGPVGELAGGGC